MRTKNEIVLKLREKYSRFAYGWDRENPDYARIINETYELLLELKEVDSEIAHREAQWLILVSKGWTYSEEYKEAFNRWAEVLPLFNEI